MAPFTRFLALEVDANFTQPTPPWPRTLSSSSDPEWQLIVHFTHLIAVIQVYTCLQGYHLLFRTGVLLWRTCDDYRQDLLNYLPRWFCTRLTTPIPDIKKQVNFILVVNSVISVLLIKHAMYQEMRWLTKHLHNIVKSIVPIQDTDWCKTRLLVNQ